MGVGDARAPTDGAEAGHRCARLPVGCATDAPQDSSVGVADGARPVGGCVRALGQGCKPRQRRWLAGGDRVGRTIPIHAAALPSELLTTGRHGEGETSAALAPECAEGDRQQSRGVGHHLEATDPTS